MSFDDNIFMRAALHGNFTMPSTSSVHRTEDESLRKNLPKRKTQNHRYTVVKDMMIVQAMEKCGREWRSVAQFMKKHADVLGNTGDLYRDMDVNDKKAIERLRKRANKILKGETLAQSQR